MLFSPINKLILYAVLLSGLLFGVYMLDKSRQKIGYDRAVAEYQTKLIAAQADAKAQELAWQSRQKDIQKETNDAINKRDDAYAGAVSAITGLRNTISNLGNGLPVDTLGSCRERAAILAQLFGECTGALVGVAKSADGQYIDKMSCINSWPSQ